jgi:flagellar biosynthesis protein FlhB
VISAAELAKALLKAALITIVGAAVLWHYREPLQQLSLLPLNAGIAQLARVAGMSFLLIAGALALIAAIDVPFQLWRHTDDLKMTREDLRREHKESEGDPQIKAAIRNQQRAMARRRMMAEVPKASVIVTNPTHYAVALRYDENSMRAPRVVAKGADLVAAKIREIGEQHRVPVLESPALARAMYGHAEIGAEIPEKLYAAVAEVLAYVFQLRLHREQGGAAPRPFASVAVPAELDPQGAPS